MKTAFTLAQKILRDSLPLVLIVAGWFALQLWILPYLGVQT
jgi:hypothetical protein